MKRVALILCAAVLCLAVPDAGAAKRKPGLYVGRVATTTSIIVFSTTKSRVKGIYVTELRAGCSDGMFLPLNVGGFAPWTAGTKIKRRAFSVSQVAPGADLTIKGKLGRTKASGTLRFWFRFNETASIDPNGSVLCDTGTLAWKARLKVNAR